MIMDEHVERKPPVWLVLATGVIAPFAAYWVGIGTSKLFWAYGPKLSDWWAQRALKFIATLIPIQFTLGIFVLLAVCLSGSNLRLRIRLVRPRIGIGTILLAVLSILFIHYLGFLLRCGVFPEPSGHLKYMERLFIESPSGLAWLLIASMAILPALCEESLYRGLVQQKLVERWHPVFAIAISSLMFAAIHVDVQHIVSAAPAGVWLGYLCWRSGSVLPGMVCHFCLNALVGLFVRFGLAGVDFVHDTLQYAVWILGLPAFLISIALLERRKRRLK